MAVDEAILETVGRGESRPTLRLYSWSPPCLSLGYAQPFSDADIASLRTAGWDIVRRPTGGRAILHVDELTYSVVGPPGDSRLSGGVLESYRNLSQALLLALQLLGVPSQASEKKTPAGATTPQAPVCFEVPSHYEITTQGKKIIGSAQSRRKRGVLQHGSLPLTGDLTRITRALTFDSPEKLSEAAARLLERATTAELALGKAVSWEQAAHAFRDAFSLGLNLEFEEESLSEVELERARELEEEKYAHPEWTQRI